MQLTKRPSHYLDAFFRDLSLPLESALSRGAAFVPSVDITENSEEYCVRAEIPGLSKEDITLEVDKNTLLLRGEKAATVEKETECFHIQERKQGSFSRAFKLPANADLSKIEATFKNGLLNIHIPKYEPTKPQAVTIKLLGE